LTKSGLKSLKELIVLGLLTLLFAGSLIVPLNVVVTTYGDQESYPRGSWGLGIVVPDGSQFGGDGELSWKNAESITAIIQLPNISYTDNTILAVMSVMAEDRSVFQVAAGIYPNQSKWLAYAWFIQNLQAYPQTYSWVLNASKPSMTAGDSVSLSIILTPEQWKFQVDDLSTHNVATGLLNSSLTSSFMVGDQEVFALESYSFTNRVFQQMGALVMKSLLVDGRQVSSGWYYYGGWDATHSPLFVVGGSNPPPFIYVHELENTTVEWNYQEWQGSVETPSYQFSQIDLIGLPIAAAAIIFVLIVKWENQHEARIPENDRTKKPSSARAYSGTSSVTSQVRCASIKPQGPAF
jgi:hypothetical protein